MRETLDERVQICFLYATFMDLRVNTDALFIETKLQRLLYYHYDFFSYFILVLDF